MQNAEEDKAKKIVKEFELIKGKRTNWDSLWEEVGRYSDPSNAENIFNTQTRGDKRHNHLFDGTAIEAKDLLASNIHMMFTNPATKWISVVTDSPELDDRDDVREWRDKVADIFMHQVNLSNFQIEAPQKYNDEVVYGTSFMIIEEDDETLFRFQTRPIWEAYGVVNNKGLFDTLYRSFIWTKKQIRDEFGEEAVSHEKLIRKSDLDEFEIIHKISPKPKDSKLTRSFKFEANYVLKKEKIILEEKGFKEKPFIFTRFSKSSAEDLGRSPAMKALADTKMINTMMKTTIKGAQKVVDPTVLLPDDGSMRPFRQTPGGINYYRAGSKDRPEPFLTNGRIDLAFQILEDVRNRIRKFFFSDKLQLQVGPQKTAEEVSKSAEEGLKSLAGFVGRQEKEFLPTMFDRVFNILNRKGKIPPPPEVLKGREIRAEFSSPMVKAIRLADSDALIRAIQLTAPILQIKPEAADNIDGDAYIRFAHKTTGLPQNLLVEVDKVEKIRKARQEAQQRAIQEQSDSEKAKQIKDAGPVLLQAGA